MRKNLHLITRFLIPLFIFALPFVFVSVFTGNKTIILASLVSLVVGLICVYFGWHRTDYDKNSKKQKTVISIILALTVAFSFFVCAISIEKEWVFDYPLEKSVDAYGCYPQMFDAFQKGQLNIDTDFDLTVFETLENPYDPNQRLALTGEKHGVFWDRAYFDGKLFSYFGVAPIFLIYFPFYFLTGHIPSDALACAVITALASVVLILLLLELINRLNTKVPFLLLILGMISLPCGALLWSSLTCANFYHIAVLFGILSITSFFLFLLKGERSFGKRRFVFLALSGVFLASTVASRPNLVIYLIVALPIFVSMLKDSKTRFSDISSFLVPTILLGALIMVYNHLRFGSPFDFGAAYQLTVFDVSKYSFSFSLIIPAIYHYFVHAPSVNRLFPYIHPVGRIFNSYGKTPFIYLDKTVGAFFFPAAWGVFLTPFVFANNKKARNTAYLSLVSVVIVAIIDMCFGGVHLRYVADIMFVLTLLGILTLLLFVGNQKRGSAKFAIAFSVVTALLIATVFVEIPLCFDNERDMILHYHPEFFKIFFY